MDPHTVQLLVNSHGDSHRIYWVGRDLGRSLVPVRAGPLGPDPVEIWVSPGIRILSALWAPDLVFDQSHCKNNPS